MCLGLPGSLPVLNKRAVEMAMSIGTALHCEVRPSSFHRKNYFYPDMPKDYQVSQYDEPINAEGWLELPDGSVVGVTRAHMEEDTGKTTHIGAGGRIHSADHSLVDYNRAGVPLVEIVSEPDIRSAAQARAYAAELRSILVATGASDGRMEEGSMRVDANVSVRPEGSEEFGTRCEIKNLNSLRSLVRAVEYEAARQIALLEAGDRVVQETRHWDEDAGRTSTMRSKEEAYDYRYFPEPDLVPVVPGAEWLAEVAGALGPMPADRRAAVVTLLGGEPTPAQADQVLTIVNLDLDPLVVAAASGGIDPALAVTRAANELAGDPERGRALDPAAFVGLLAMEAKGELSATQAKAVLSELAAAGGGDPAAVAKGLGFEALSEDSLTAAVAEAVAANPVEWARFCEGDEKLAGLFTGAVMKATQRPGQWGGGEGRAGAPARRRLTEIPGHRPGWRVLSCAP